MLSFIAQVGFTIDARKGFMWRSALGIGGMLFALRLIAAIKRRTAKVRFRVFTGMVWASLAPIGAVRTLEMPMAATAGTKIAPAQAGVQAAGEELRR